MRIHVKVNNMASREITEQQMVTKCLVTLQKSPIETVKMLEETDDMSNVESCYSI